MVIRWQNDSENGFTLVEMLIVVILLGIVATIAVLSLSNVNQNSQVSACKTDYQSVNAALAAYRNDFADALTNQVDSAYPTATVDQKIDLYAQTSILKGLGYMAVLAGGPPDGLYKINLEVDPDTTNKSGYRAKVMKVVDGIAVDVSPLATTPSADDCNKIKS